MIAKGDTSWTLQRVQYGPGGGLKRSPARAIRRCVRTPGYHLCAYNFAGQGLVTNEWLHFMVVLEEPGMKLYINGQLNASESAGPWNKGDHDLGIGNQTQNLGGRRQWDGILDEARVMQAARSRGLGEARLREPAGVADAPQVWRNSESPALILNRRLHA